MVKKESAVEVYKATGEMEALVIKSLLESYGIPCFFKSNAAPSVHVLTIDGLGQYKIMVPASAAEEAKELIRTREETETEGDKS
ncbi:MAG: DUF2007 domain-containing protein [Chloroflexi bacterium]|nr:DUF2007 domain-containing protein [Chloroflexota bacterium]